MKTVLITRPEHDTTVHYLSRWINSVMKKARLKGIKILDQHREKANRKAVESLLKKENPELVVFQGHGDFKRIKGHKDEVLIEQGNNEGLLKNKIIYALTCSSGHTLGPSAVEKGAKSFLGYKEDFIFERTDSSIIHPENDPLANAYLAPSEELVLALIKGNSCKEAFSRSQKMFMNEIRKRLTSEGSDPITIRMLWWNMSNQVCLGDESATI